MFTFEVKIQAEDGYTFYRRFKCQYDDVFNTEAEAKKLLKPGEKISMTRRNHDGKPVSRGGAEYPDIVRVA